MPRVSGATRRSELGRPAPIRQRARRGPARGRRHGTAGAGGRSAACDGRPDGRASAVVTHLHHVTASRSATTRRGSSNGSPTRRHRRQRDSATSTPSPTSRRSPDAGRRLPLAYAEANGGRAGDDLAVGLRRAGQGRGRAAPVSRLRLGPRRDRGRIRAGTRSTGRPSATRRSIRPTTSGCRPGSPSAEMALRLRLAIAATGGTPPRTPSRRSSRPSTCPAAMGWSSMSGRRVMAWPSATTMTR